MALAVLEFLVGFGASTLSGITIGAVKKIAQAVGSKSLESLFVDSFLKTLDYHDKHHDQVAKKHVAVLRKAVKSDRERVLNIFARNSDHLQTFLTPIGRQEFQSKVAQEILSEFSLATEGPDGLMLAIVTDCLDLYRWAFLQRMSQRQALQAILSQTLKIDNVLELLEQIRGQLDPQLRARYSDLQVQDIAGRLKVDLSKLPATGSLLLARESQLQWLDEAWQTDTTHIFSLVAWGGVGKTALVNYWLTHKMGPDDYRGAQRVFGWSFYSQGTSEDRQASSDIFLVEALKWFGDAETAESEQGSWQKGLRLAELVQQHKTLLILDGAEPLQYPPGPMQGRLKDQGLQALLKQLAAANQGLCVITTRQKIEDIEQYKGPAFRRVLLENLAEQAGVDVLKSYKIDGTDAELREAVKEYGRHALALNLLGTYLAKIHHRHIRRRDRIPQLIDVRQRQGEHAYKVMAAYEKHLKGTAELDLLYILGLFDRPAEAGAIDTLRQKPPIPGPATEELSQNASCHSERSEESPSRSGQTLRSAQGDSFEIFSKLSDLSDSDYALSLANLRELRLIAQEDKGRPGTLDCHPLVREYFGQRLQENSSAAWRQAHSRLYEYYKNLPEKELPDTLAEMQPLFAAVAHGCQAGLHQEALDDVYWDRICRKKEKYSVKQLGAFGSDLSALASFFDEPWTKPASALKEKDRTWVLSLAGFALRAVGRLREAAQPMQAGMQTSIDEKDWKGAVFDAGNLSELYLTLGEIKEAVDFAERSVEYADRSKEWGEKMICRTTLAGALHQAGDITRAEQLFREAEQMQTQAQPGHPYLYSFRGFQFCDLLLSQGRYREVQKRFARFIEWRLPSDSLLEIALEHLLAGRAYLLQAQEEGSGDFGRAADYLNQAVEGLRESGNQDDIPRGLLARAGLYRLQGDFDRAWRDLAEAAEIAERGEMKLFMADYHLESARLCLAAGDKEKAREHYEKAEALVNETGYHRRGSELEELGREMS